MKFGKQLEIGIYEPWKDQYIQYSRLKRIIIRKKFVLDEKPTIMPAAAHESNQPEVEMTGTSYTALNESTPLLNHRSLTPAVEVEGALFDEFFDFIEDEMKKINKFYLGKLAELKLLLEGTGRNRNMYRSHHAGGHNAKELNILRNIYIQSFALKSYCDLNKIGFYKIIKKYDKAFSTSTLKHWQAVVDRQLFSTTSEPQRLIDSISDLVSQEQLVNWENFVTGGNFLGSNNIRDSSIIPSVRLPGIVISIVLFVLSIVFPFAEKDPIASRCLSLLILIVSMWITEALPYFATALLIPILVTTMGVLKDPSDATGQTTIDPEAASQFVLGHMFNHTSALILGGYTISSAFSRCKIELRVASFLQTQLGHMPLAFLFAVMCLGFLLSMMISNHTAPILCSAIILPIIRDLPNDSRFSKALLLGLAFASNFGGMLTPISSLQNVLAVAHLQETAGIEISFLTWVSIALPFGFICTVISWALVILLVQPNDVTVIPIVVYNRTDSPMTLRNITVVSLTVIIVLVFGGFGMLKPYLGDIGIASICFIFIMFGSGLLTEVDFNSLSWHTIMLLGGGSVLGKAVISSNLLDYLSASVVSSLPLGSPWLSLFYIVCCAGVVSTFISHTVAAIILMPIIAHVGLSLGIPEKVVICSAFAVSGAMALPFSSFPNVNSLLMVDDFRKSYLTTSDFVLTGLPLSILTMLLISTLACTFVSLVI